MSAIAGKAEGRSRCHHVRHGRHDRQARCDRRRRAGDHALLRDRSHPLQEGQRLADQRPGGRDGGDRRRRRQHRARRQGDDRRGPGERRSGAGPDLLRARRARSRPSPMPTWCWGTSRRTGSTPGRCASMPPRRQGGHRAQDRCPTRYLGGAGSLGHPSGGHVEHGKRAAPRVDRARARSEALRHGGVRRRRPFARGTDGTIDRHSHGDRALRRGHRLGHRLARCRAALRRHGYAGDAATLRQLRATLRPYTGRWRRTCAKT